MLLLYKINTFIDFFYKAVSEGGNVSPCMKTLQWIGLLSFQDDWWPRTVRVSVSPYCSSSPREYHQEFQQITQLLFFDQEISRKGGRPSKKKLPTSLLTLNKNSFKMNGFCSQLEAAAGSIVAHSRSLLMERTRRGWRDGGRRELNRYTHETSAITAKILLSALSLSSNRRRCWLVHLSFLLLFYFF